MSRAYYNEIDPYAAEWLKNLIAAGHIAPGDVDTRSITDVAADDLRSYTQCHFFTGIGVWSHALRLSGWSDDRPVWTGSCPCQPFSVAGKGAGQTDDRHLWPVWFKIIEQCRPPVVFGEQVEAAIRHGWLDLVQRDLEGIGYASGAVCIPAGSVGAPHIRQRLWFVAHSESARGRFKSGRFSSETPSRIREQEREDERWAMLKDRRPGDRNTVGELADSSTCGRQDESTQQRSGNQTPRQRQTAEFATDCGNGISELADSIQPNHRRQTEPANHRKSEAIRPANRIGGCGSSSGELANAKSHRNYGSLRDHKREKVSEVVGRGFDLPEPRSTCPTNYFWRDADWLFCRDGKWRPVEPGTFPLAYGAPARVGRLRAYGNAIVPQVAQEVIQTFMEYAP